MIRSRRFWIGLAVSVFFLFLFVYFFYKEDPGKVADAFKSANYVYIIPAVALYFIAVCREPSISMEVSGNWEPGRKEDN